MGSNDITLRFENPSKELLVELRLDKFFCDYYYENNHRDMLEDMIVEIRKRVLEVYEKEHEEEGDY